MPALIMAALLALAVIAALGLTASPANATPTFTTCASSTACHNQSGGDAFHGKAGHQAAASCTTCHVDGFGVANAGVKPRGCMTCHAPASDVVKKPTHTTQGCGTTAGCHGVASTATPTPTPTPTATAAATTLTAKVAPTIVKLGKKVKVTGLAGPTANLAGAKIGVKVVRKVGTKWVKMKAPATATVTATGAYTWTYKTVKKGAHKVTLTVKATTAYTFKTMTKSFKVK